MQDRPDATVLLEAIADFLMKEVMPAVKSNDALAFKTLVSWNMLGVMGRELKHGEGFLNEEIKRSVQFLMRNGAELPASASHPGGTYHEKKDLARILNSQLSKLIREKKLTNEDSEVWNLVKQSVTEKLAVSNPRSQN